MYLLYESICKLNDVRTATRARKIPMNLTGNKKNIFERERDRQKHRQRERERKENRLL